MDRYIVERCADMLPLTVWGYLSQARSSALNHTFAEKEDTSVILERKGRRYLVSRHVYSLPQGEV